MSHEIQANAKLAVLLVEDNPADVLLTREALRSGEAVSTTLTVARDGVEAMEMLRGAGPHAGAARPDLILMDLNMPRKDGRELLAEIKSDPDLRRIPVVVLTTSSAERDVRQSYDLHANSYVVKPPELDDFFEAMRLIQRFWLGVSVLPKRE